MSETEPCNVPSPCEMPKMNLASKRFVVMQQVHDRNIPVSIHENLEQAMADIGKRAAGCLLNWYDTQRSALCIVAVDR